MRTIPFNITVNLTLLLVFSTICVILVKRGFLLHSATWFFMGIIALIYTLIFRTIKYPAEKIHFLQYGILAFLVYRALRISRTEIWSYTLTLLICGILGSIDEGIQHLLPKRYFDMRDVYFNILGSGLGLSMIFVVRIDRGMSFKDPKNRSQALKYFRGLKPGYREEGNLRCEFKEVPSFFYLYYGEFVIFNQNCLGH